MHDHWGVTYAHDDDATCNQVRRSAEDALGNGNAVVVDTHAQPALAVGDPCPACQLPLEWDKQEHILYCTEDYAHG